MAVMNIYVTLGASRSFLLIGMLLLGFSTLGMLTWMWRAIPFHPAMVLVTASQVISLLSWLLLVPRRHFPYLICAASYFTLFICPVVMCLIAMVLTTGNEFRFVAVLPYIALVYNLVITGLEYRGIDFDRLPPKARNKPFRRSGDGGLFFNPHASVLFLSPWRNDDSWFFAGPIRRLQQLLVVVLFIYMMWMFAAKIQTENATGVASAFGVMLSLAAFVMQPYLLQHLIKLRLVLLKGEGRI